jgi:class 3 adenylate cyclase
MNKKILRAEFNKKLSTKMMFFILSTVFVIMISLGFITWHFAKGLLAEQIETKSKNKVELAATFIHEKLTAHADVLELMGMRELTRPEQPSFNKGYFEKILKKHSSKGIASIYMGIEGGGYATGGGWTPPPSYNHHKRPWYIAAAKAKTTVFTNPYIDARTGKKAITVARPLYKKGKLYAVISMDVLLYDIENIVKSLRIGKKGRALLVNSKGEFLYHYKTVPKDKNTIMDTGDSQYFSAYKKGILQGTSKSETEIYEGDNYVVISRIAAPDWYLVFHLPYSEVKRPVRKLRLLIIIAIIGCLILLSGAVLYFSHKITKPLLALAKGVQKVAKGDLEVGLTIKSHDEIGYLSSSFNQMVDGLKDREFIKSTFGRYVSKDVMRDILSGNIELGGEKMELAILFSDIRGFTTLSEDMDPIMVVKLLNGYFTEMDKAISQEGGSINKYMGDGILAVFGAPNTLENSSQSALCSAWGKIDALEEFCKKSEVQLKIGIGIHTGEAVVGNIGSMERMEYTVIGDAVNLASRVESLTKQYGSELLITEATLNKLTGDGILFKTVDRVRVKGKNQPVSLFEPLRMAKLSKDELNHIANINSMMELYFNGDFIEALKIAESLTNIDIHIELIKERLKHLIDNPPHEWDGVSTMTRK